MIVEGEMNYTDPNTRRRLQNLLHDLEALPKISEHLTKSWLQHFETVASAKEIFLNESDSYASETEFVRDVYEYYKDRDTSFSLDVAFNENNTRIVASRFLVQGEKIRSTSDEEKLVLDIRRVCKQHTDGSFGVSLFAVSCLVEHRKTCSPLLFKFKIRGGGVHYCLFVLYLRLG